MDEIVINRIIVFLFFAISVGLTYLIIRKSNSKAKDKNKAKAGCLSAFFIWVPISLLVGLTPFMLLLGAGTAKELYQLASDSDFKSYTAQVVRYEDTYTSEERDSDGRTRYVEMGTPVVTFTIESGQELERALPFATELNGYRWSSGKTKSLLTDMKNISVVDDIALNDSLNVILSASNTWFKKTDYKKDGISWAGSVVYKIVPDFNVYFTYADSLKDGASKFYDPADYFPSHPLYGQTISFNPYRSTQYELGVKTRVNEIDFSAAVFQITRPTYYEVNGIFGRQGDQRNRGIEFTTGGKIVDSLSAYGGITFIDPKMNKSANQKVV